MRGNGFHLHPYHVLLQLYFRAFQRDPDPPSGYGPASMILRFCYVQVFGKII